MGSHSFCAEIRGNLAAIPFFPFLGLRDDTQVISLGKKCLYSLRHGIGPKQIFI